MKSSQKPPWIRSKWPYGPEIVKIKKILRQNDLHTVCEEANCPNLSECFSRGVATFMIMGDFCTRNCLFCNVKHGPPKDLDKEEPEKIAKIVTDLNLRHVVITSVTRDDLKDGGAKQFSLCIKEIRFKNKGVWVEILTPDFRKIQDEALTILVSNPSDIFSHNVETVPRLYQKVRPEADFQVSLALLKKHRTFLPNVPTKSGLMLGLGEKEGEVIEVLKELRSHGVSMVTLGQYLQPSREHFAVIRFVPLSEFAYYEKIAEKLGFTYIASSPFARSSYRIRGN